MKTRAFEILVMVGLTGALTSPALFAASGAAGDNAATPHLPLLSAVIAGFALLLIAGAVMTVVGLLRAPEAYEDERGFHLARGTTHRSASPGLASRHA